MERATHRERERILRRRERVSEAGTPLSSRAEALVPEKDGTPRLGSTDEECCATWRPKICNLFVFSNVLCKLSQERIWIQVVKFR